MSIAQCGYSGVARAWTTPTARARCPSGVSEKVRGRDPPRRPPRRSRARAPRASGAACRRSTGGSVQVRISLCSTCLMISQGCIGRSASRPRSATSAADGVGSIVRMWNILHADSPSRGRLLRSSRSRRHATTGAAALEATSVRAFLATALGLTLAAVVAWAILRSGPPACEAGRRHRRGSLGCRGPFASRRDRDHGLRCRVGGRL